MRYSLADHDGTLCVVAHSADSDQPISRAQFYPTTVGTRDFLRFHYDYALADDSGRWAGLLAGFAVRQDFAGLYSVESPRECNRLPVPLPLTDGGRTLPVHQVTTPIKPPRHRLRIEYYGSRWRVETARGWKDVDAIV